MIEHMYEDEHLYRTRAGSAMRLDLCPAARRGEGRISKPVLVLWKTSVCNTENGNSIHHDETQRWARSTYMGKRSRPLFVLSNVLLLAF